MIEICVKEKPDSTHEPLSFLECHIMQNVNISPCEGISKGAILKYVNTTLSKVFIVFIVVMNEEVLNICDYIACSNCCARVHAVAGPGKQSESSSSYGSALLHWVSWARGGDWGSAIRPLTGQRWAVTGAMET